MKIKGVWFYGLAGSGKSFASKKLSNKIKKSYVIDGDNVRKHISTDLGYKKEDRLKQINRICGMSIITIENSFFPIASSVYMTNKILTRAKNSNILVIEIIRDRKKIIKSRSIYIKNKNVIGKDIVQRKLKTKKIINDKKKEFINEINKIVIE